MRKMLLLIITLWSCQNVKESKEFYQNGKLKSIRKEWNGGLGEMISYDTVGSILSIEHFRNDTLHGESKYYRAGKIFEISNFKNGFREGVSLRYYSNGNLLDSAFYEEGMRRGIYRVFFSDKNGLKALESYSIIVGDEDYLYYTKKYGRDGNVIEQEMPLLLDICFDNESRNHITLNFLVDTDQEYDSAKIVIGDFDDRFINYSFSDTVKLTTKSLSYKSQPKQYSHQHVRGALITYRTVINKNYSEVDSLIRKEYETLNYFEKKILPDFSICKGSDSQ